jgi:2-polyprenyl-3-methyl-5-hydroxy-6-metoxy-1,4-benzoquinol methylase
MKWLEAANKHPDGAVRHRNLRPVIYTHFKSSQLRIIKSREYLETAVCLAKIDHPGRPISIFEMGCGTMDITGPFSRRDDCVVKGCDCNQAALNVAKQRWPKVTTVLESLSSATDVRADVLVACEILEHLRDPIPIMQSLMHQCEYAVISHPIDQPLTSQSARHGHHCWVYDMQDFAEWFSMNEYACLKYENGILSGGVVLVAIGVGKKRCT